MTIGGTHETSTAGPRGHCCPCPPACPTPRASPRGRLETRAASIGRTSYLLSVTREGPFLPLRMIRVEEGRELFPSSSGQPG